MRASRSSEFVSAPTHNGSVLLKHACLLCVTRLLLHPVVVEVAVMATTKFTQNEQDSYGDSESKWV